MWGISWLSVKGAGGVPWVQIMENEFECLFVRGGDGGHFAEKFVKKYSPSQSYHDYRVTARQQLTISAIISKLSSTRVFELEP